MKDSNLNLKAPTQSCSPDLSPMNTLADFALNHPSIAAACFENGAGTFKWKGHTIVHFISNITPKKIGQFVSIWKRNEQGITAPYDDQDQLDFMVIGSESGNNKGYFVFPKVVLLQQGILSNNGKGGKRGIRVYPPWDTAANPQAVQTQGWQLQYFVSGYVS